MPTLYGATMTHSGTCTWLTSESSQFSECMDPGRVDDDTPAPSLRPWQACSTSRRSASTLSSSTSL